MKRLPTKTDVVKVARVVVSKLAPANLRVELHDRDIHDEYGAWVIPLYVGANVEQIKAKQLMTLLERIEERIGEELDYHVRVILDPFPSTTKKNGK